MPEHPDVDEHPNAALIRKLQHAILAGDLEGVLDAYTEDAVYRVAGNNLLSGTHRGREAIAAFFVKAMEITGGTLRIVVDDVLAEDGHAVIFWSGGAERPGKSLDAHGIMAFKVNDDGKFTESWWLYDDQAAYDDFFSAAATSPTEVTTS
ncbi:MAG: uncharacterized protein QOJ69_1133 [Actinomycetota bacterium]|nr:uncharacterized protein [Actinomycetota bacterium]